MRTFTQYGVFASVSKAFVLVLCLFGKPILAEPMRVLMLGDSLTQGYGLREADGLVPQLQAWLVAQGEEAELINGGVSGDTTAGGLARVAWSLTPDIDAVVVALGGNDVLRGLAPEGSRANIAGILDITTARGLPVLVIGIKAPGNYGPQYKEAFDRIHPELAKQHGALFVESFFAAIEKESPTALLGLLQADGLHPNPAGVARIVETLGPDMQRLIGRIQ
jgi:acyl-CoA thioesterase-1